MSIKNDSIIKVIDCFIFYNEIQMLTYRLNVLNDVVDYFIIVEATHSFSGKEKPLFFKENKHLFDKFQDKIIHIIVEDFPYKYPNINYSENQQWKNENFQRKCISRGINKLKYSNKLKNEDIILISDLDEIIDPTTLYKIKKKEINIDNGIYILEMDLYYYNLITKYNEKWHFPKLISYKKYNELNADCELIRWYNIYVNPSVPVIKNGGWHLSYFGDCNFIKNKLETCAHQEYNSLEYTDTDKIKNKIKDCRDLFNRNNNPIRINISDNNYLPPEYENYLKNFY
jgi:beta-1,4-mannosyl-glycoprotein beta-1,4-N-acetylglucosaminyltransferase